MATAVAVVATLMGFGLNACGADSSEASPRSEGEGVIEEFAPTERVVLPNFSGVTLEGGTYDLKEHRGEVVVLNVWGSWCAPCRAEAPALRRVSTEFAASNVSFVGVDVRDNDASAKAFERSYGISYPSISSATSTSAVLAIGDVVPSSAVPSTVILDRDGRVAARVVGASSYTTLEDLVGTVVAEGEAGGTARG